MSSTNRGYKRHKSDYYVTPIKDIKLFIDEIVKYESNIFDGKILDPCAGGDKSHKMSYPTALLGKRVTDNINTIDIRKDSRAEIITNYLEFNPNKKYDCIITNPPFKIARDIIEKSLKDVKENGFVIMLLRLNYFGTQKRFDLWQEYMPKYTFVHHKRMSFTDKGGTDSIEYAHFVWQKGNYPEFTKLKVI